MRVLLLNDAASPMGGAELQAVRTRQLLRSAGHEVRLLASTATSLSGATTVADRTCFGTVHPRLRVLTQTVNPSAVAALRGELATFRPDVVHLRMFLTQLSPLVLALLRDVPTVWQAVFYKAVCPRGTKVLPDGSPCRVRAGVVCLRNRCVTPQTWALDMTQQRLLRRYAGAIDAVVTLSDASRRVLEGNGVACAGVVPNAVDVPPARAPLPAQPLIGYAGRLVMEKGVDVLLRAVAALGRPDVRVVVAGDGPARGDLEQLAHALGLTGRVTFLGHVERATVERHLRPAWVQVVPGRWAEPLGNVTLEAMARGTAVVATAVGGPAEMVVDGTTGVLVAPDDVGSLAGALATLLSDRARCEALGWAGRKRAEAEYSPARLLRRLERLYATVVRT